MSDAPEIKVKLTAEDTGVSAAIKELTSQLKNLKKQQDETASSGISLSRAFEGIAAAGALLKIGEIGKEAFDSAVNIGKMADKTGLSTQTLSVFHHVAEEAGVSTEAVDKALVKAAKSITEFQQGSAKAAKGFQLLGITQKDFAGLKSDEKIALVTTKLGQMSASFQKTTAAQLIFSKGGAEFIPVANAIAGEGFDKITASVGKLGLLLDKTTTDSFRVAKAQMQELKDVGTGMATQFEAGLLPAITDVAKALVGSTVKGGDGFKEVGKVAGTAIKDVAYVFFFLGDSVSAIVAEIQVNFEQMWDHITSGGKLAYAEIGRLAHLDFAAASALEAQATANKERINKEAAAKVKAIWDQTAVDIRQKSEDLFPSDQEAKRRAAEDAKNLRPDDQKDAPEVTPDQKPTDAAAKARLAQDEKQLQDELAIHRAYAKQTEQVDKEMYDAGEISLAEYFDRRKTAVTSDTEEETAILRRGIARANEEAQKATLARNAAKGKGDDKGEDKQEATRLEALTKIGELQTKIRELEINSSTKIAALDTEEFKKKQESQQKDLEFEKELGVLQGKKTDVARAELAIAVQKRTLELQQEGASKERIDAEIAQLTTLKTARADFAAKDKAAEDALKLLDDQKAAIQDKVANGKLFQVQADQQIVDLYRQQLPALQQLATQLTANAKTEEEIVQAATLQKNIDKAKSATAIAGQQIASLKSTLEGSLTSGFTNLFANLTSGTKSVGDSFKTLAASVVSSLAQVAAQMLATLLIKKLLGSDEESGGGGGGGAGGLLGGLLGAFGGHAEGGLIKGPGGPKADAIPARLSAGEYIVKADAVSAFGVHNLEAINRGLKIPSIANLSLPKFSEGGLVGGAGGPGDSNINLGIGLDEGLILKHLSSKAAGNIIVQHLANNPKAASKALSRGGG